jgi:Holliday junction resolvase RusA-like endonuclease
MNLIKIIINKDVVNKYNEYYFSLYPKRHVKPIINPFPPSLNRFTASLRMAQNAMKQNYKAFSFWLASYYCIANLNLEKVKISYTFFFPDHRRRDFDNLVLTPKFFNDGFVEAGVMKDDNGENLRIEFNNFQYDKKNPRVELDIEY